VASFCFGIALRMTVAQSSRSSPGSPAVLFAEEVSIVAVHGLGGHWKTTWMGEKEKKIWLRDFLPDQLAHAGIKSRVMSFGYNSDTAFSKAITDIDDEAEMLLDRLNGYRQTPEEKSRPILFISHSLGGIVMKKVRLLVSYLENLTEHIKTIIIAHERLSVYGNLLQNVRATVFLGVPHRGSDAAYWALFATRLLQFGQVGFGTNPA
jgi:triacylglycerol esterase/lipase EstA (alpha/beta hydrolase family)